MGVPINYATKGVAYLTDFVVDTVAGSIAWFSMGATPYSEQEKNAIAENVVKPVAKAMIEMGLIAYGGYGLIRSGRGVALISRSGEPPLGTFAVGRSFVFKTRRGAVIALPTQKADVALGALQALKVNNSPGEIIVIGHGLRTAETFHGVAEAGVAEINAAVNAAKADMLARGITPKSVRLVVCGGSSTNGKLAADVARGTGLRTWAFPGESRVDLIGKGGERLHLPVFK